MTSRLGLFGSVVSLNAKPKRLAATFLKPTLMPLLSFAHASNRAPYAAAALATIPHASRMQKTRRGLPMEPEPNLVISSASQRVVVENVPFKVDIYKLEGGEGWSLEVVTEGGTSIVWDDLFDDDRAAFEEALTTIQKEGPVAFVKGDENVIPFRR